MPTSIKILEKNFNLNYLNTYNWGTPFIEGDNGIYIISQSKERDYLPSENIEIGFNDVQFDTLGQKCPQYYFEREYAKQASFEKTVRGFLAS